MLHGIKLNLVFCDAVYDGTKTFEVRQNDRDYQKGDYIEFIPVSDLGAMAMHPIYEKIYVITYVLTGWGIEPGYCVFAIKEFGNKRDCRDLK